MDGMEERPVEVRVRGVSKLRASLEPGVKWDDIISAVDSPPHLVRCIRHVKHGSSPAFNTPDSFNRYWEQCNALNSSLEVELWPEATDEQRLTALELCNVSYLLPEQMERALDILGEQQITWITSGTMPSNPSVGSPLLIAECRTRAELYFVFRGTADQNDYMTDLKAHGFYEHMQLLDKNLLLDILKQRPSWKIILTGHSLGAAAAALRLVTLLNDLREADREAGRIRMIGFGCPLFADEKCVQRVHQDYKAKHLFEMYVAEKDPVPRTVVSVVSTMCDQAVSTATKKVEGVLREVKSPYTSMGRWLVFANEGPWEVEEMHITEDLEPNDHRMAHYSCILRELWGHARDDPEAAGCRPSVVKVVGGGEVCVKKVTLGKEVKVEYSGGPVLVRQAMIGAKAETVGDNMRVGSYETSDRLPYWKVEKLVLSLTDASSSLELRSGVGKLEVVPLIGRPVTAKVKAKNVVASDNALHGVEVLKLVHGAVLLSTLDRLQDNREDSGLGEAVDTLLSEFGFPEAMAQVTDYYAGDELAEKLARQVAAFLKEEVELTEGSTRYSFVVVGAVMAAAAVGAMVGPVGVLVAGEVALNAAGGATLCAGGCGLVTGVVVVAKNLSKTRSIGKAKHKEKLVLALEALGPGGGESQESQEEKEEKDIDALERELVSRAGCAPSFNKKSLTSASRALLQKLVRRLCHLHELKEIMLKRRLLMTAGCKNRGKSTLCSTLGCEGVKKGTGTSTLAPQPYKLEGTWIVDLPGVDDTHDINALAERYIKLGAVCGRIVVVVHSAHLGKEDEKLVRDLLEEIPPSRIMVVVTHADMTDADSGDYVVETLGGVDATKQFVLDQLKVACPTQRKVLVESMRVTTLHVGHDRLPHNLPHGVLNRSEIKETILEWGVR